MGVRVSTKSRLRKVNREHRVNRGRERAKKDRLWWGYAQSTQERKGRELNLWDDWAELRFGASVRTLTDETLSEFARCLNEREWGPGSIANICTTVRQFQSHKRRCTIREWRMLMDNIYRGAVNGAPRY